jgi:membrane protein implicated in regulation of membrane protease activity
MELKAIISYVVGFGLMIAGLGLAAALLGVRSGWIMLGAFALVILLALTLVARWRRDAPPPPADADRPPAGPPPAQDA